MAMTAEQVTAARKLLGWSQMGLALKAGVNVKTVAQLEMDSVGR
jgi:DNA-binding XRE family transcriptional regulator